MSKTLSLLISLRTPQASKDSILHGRGLDSKDFQGFYFHKFQHISFKIMYILIRTRQDSMDCQDQKPDLL